VGDRPSKLSLRLSGEITQVSTNGIVRIETPEGRIDAQIRNTRGNQSTLQTGQPIDIEIPAGRPPQQATLRPPSVTLPTDQGAGRNNQGITNQPSQNITTQNITPNNASQNNNVSRDNYVRPDQNFLTNNRTQPIQAETVRAPAQTQQATPLQADATVRLLAVPPAQAQKIATDFIQTVQVQPNTLARVPFTANLIADNIQTQILNGALQIKAPIAQNTALTITPNTQNSLLPILNNNLSQTPILTPQINVVPPQTNSQTQALQTPTILPVITNTATPIPTGALLPPDITSPLLQNIPVAPSSVQSTPNTQPPTNYSCGDKLYARYFEHK